MDTKTIAHQRYQWAEKYNTSIGYHDKVTENENMIGGNQWEGVVSNGLPTPVFNIEKRIMDYKVSACASQKVKAVYGIEGVSQYGVDSKDLTDDELRDMELAEVANLMSGNAEVRWEKLKMDYLIRRWLRDGFVTGDMFAHTYWDTSIKTGQKAKGDFVTERVHGSNVFFGNPADSDPQNQPWIIIKIRDTVDNLKKEASEAGLKKDKIDLIVSDTKTETQTGKYGKIEMKGDDTVNKCNAYLMYYKQDDGTVYWSKSTENVTIRENVSTKIKRYPIDHGVWDYIENCYHGKAECSEIHANQRFINKMFALCMIWFSNNAFGKVVFDQTRISGWSNDVAEAIAVNGNVHDVVQQLSAGNFNSAIMMVIDYAIKYTKEMQGATDAALGQERADNTSALIVLQKASSLPLENQQSRLFQFIEDIYLTWAEFMLAYYIKDRLIPIKDDDGNVIYQKFTKQDAEKLAINVRIEVGASSFWSEAAEIEILDNMLQNNRITFIQYLERLPNGFITNKQKLIDEVKAMALHEPQEALTDDTRASQGYEEMAMFMDNNLPQEVQQQLYQLPPEEMERQVQSLMNAQPEAERNENVYRKIYATL